MTTVSTSAADQVRSAFDFTVDKFPLSGPDGMRTPWYAMFRSDTSEVVGEGSSWWVVGPRTARFPPTPGRCVQASE